ncbi:MAG: dihydroorotase [Pseudomonadales bacterium]
MLKISNGRLIDPANELDQIADIFIDDGVIQAIGHPPSGATIDQEIDASGQVVAPGIIDMSAHLREPGASHKATIASETAAAASAGITTLLCPPSTKPVIDSTAVAEFIQDRAALSNRARVLPIGALSKELAGEQLAPMAALRQSGCIAFSNARNTIANSQTLLRCLEYAATHDYLVIFNPQDNSLVGSGVIHEGIPCTEMGLTGISEAAETIEVARCLILVEQSGVRAHFGQLSCDSSVKMIAQARERGLPVSADVAIHQLLFTDENTSGFNSMFHVQPPLRSQLDRAGLLNALVTEGIQVICSDHQPHEAAAKEAPFAATEPGISGLETLLPLGLGLVERGLINLSQLIHKLTVAPAQILGIEGGTLAVGQRADIMIFDPEIQWQVSAESLLSAGKNSPFIGSSLKGKVTNTLMAGEWVYQAGLK